MLSSVSYIYILKNYESMSIDEARLRAQPLLSVKNDRLLNHAIWNIYSIAASRSDHLTPRAYYRLATCFSAGIGCEQNDDEAFQLFQAACEKGMYVVFLEV